jgi:hypothetical protein
MITSLPEVVVERSVWSILEHACNEPHALEDLEDPAARGSKISSTLEANKAWKSLADGVMDAWRTFDHVIVRGMPVTEDGASLVLAASILRGRFKTYRGGNVVKTFRMSPWTPGLSHTLREGAFHTDLNTDPSPPAATCIQCRTRDPGSPDYGVNRVARATDILAYLADHEKHDLLRFVHHPGTAMVNDRSGPAWVGPIVSGIQIRFHPETIRAALRRLGEEDDLEPQLSGLHEAAMAVSDPFWLDEGDTLLVSNHRALHYRGECSVAFTEFPLSFLSRSIHVLHVIDEPR